MSDPKNEEPIEDTPATETDPEPTPPVEENTRDETDPEDDTPGTDDAPEAENPADAHPGADDSADADDEEAETPADEDAAAAEPEAEAEAPDVSPDENTPPTNDAADAATVAIPVQAAPDPSEAPTTAIPIRAHTPKAEPQRIEPRASTPPPPPAYTPNPNPTRVPATKGKERRLWTVTALLAVVVVAAIVAVVAFVRYQSTSGPDARIRASIDTFVAALSAGDLETLQTTTCGGLAEFYATIGPDEFEGVHDLSVQQGSLPVVRSIDKVQINEDTAIVEVTAHPKGDPADVTARTFDLALVDDEWKICSD